MPSSAQALHVTDSYRARMGMLRQRAELQAATAWRHINPDDLDTTHAAWARITALRLVELQRAGATLSGAYLSAYVAIETGRRSAPAASVVDLSGVGISRSGKPLVDALGTSLLTIKRAIGDGATPQRAMSLGLQRAVRNSNEDVAYVGRTALQAGIQQRDEIIGWRRVTGGGCGACLASATGAIQADDEVLLVHDNCQCSKEPVVRDAPDRLLRPTGEEVFHRMTASEQDALFAGRGGAEKADLIRSGHAPFHSLIEHQPMAVTPDQITEASLGALHAHE